MAGKKLVVLPFFCCHKFQKIYFYRNTEIKWSQLTKKSSIFNAKFFLQSAQKILVGGSEIRIQGSKKHQSPDPDPPTQKKKIVSGGK